MEPYRLFLPKEASIFVPGRIVVQPLRNKARRYGAEKYARPNLERAYRGELSSAATNGPFEALRAGHRAHLYFRGRACRFRRRPTHTWPAVTLDHHA